MYNIVLEGNNNYLGTHNVYIINDKFVYIFSIYIHTNKITNYIEQCILLTF